jgi:hypothetical protein
MPMHNPPHPGLTVRHDCLEPLGLTVTEGAKVLGVTRQALRACLKRSRSGCETPHHQVDHGDSDPRLGGLRQGLEVFTQPPRAIEPAEGAFHDPAPLHDLKTSGVPRAFHNDEGPLQHRCNPCDPLNL